MMKFYASLLLLVNVFILKSNGEACAEAKLTCNKLTITFDPALSSNGEYIKVENENNLYQKGNYYFSYYAAGGYYTISEEDNRCLRRISYNTKLLESQLSSLTNGNPVDPFTPEFPKTVTYRDNNGNVVSVVDVTITIACDGVAEIAPEPTPPPTEQIVANGNLCFAGKPGWEVGNPSVSVTTLSGEYEPIGNINGYPAYQLSSECPGTRPYIVYVTGCASGCMSNFNEDYYMVLTKKTDPNSYITFCKASSMTNNDITTCDWSQAFTIANSGGSCECGQTIPN